MERAWDAPALDPAMLKAVALILIELHLLRSITYVLLVGMNVGTHHWETIRADNILYVLRQPESTQNQSALLYVVRRNGIQPRRMSLADLLAPSILSR